MRVYLDVETTGLKEDLYRIVEIGAVVVGAVGIETAALEMLVHPGEEALAAASEDAWRVNGLSPEVVRRGVPEAQAAERLDRFLSRFWGAELHAYNIDFDAWFLERTPWKIPRTSWGECVMAAARSDMDLGKNPKLATAARWYKVEQTGAHRALADARTAARIHQEILRRRGQAQANDEVKHLMDEGL